MTDVTIRITGYSDSLTINTAPVDLCMSSASSYSKTRDDVRDKEASFTNEESLTLSLLKGGETVSYYGARSMPTEVHAKIPLRKLTRNEGIFKNKRSVCSKKSKRNGRGKESRNWKHNRDPDRRHQRKKTAHAKKESGKRKTSKTAHKFKTQVNDHKHKQCLISLSSSSSPSTSLESMFSSPISPSPRFKKKYMNIVKSKSRVEEESVPRTMYQNVLTKYYKARRVVKNLIENFKLEESKNALMELVKQKDALCKSDENDESENDINNNSNQPQDFVAGNSEIQPNPYELQMLKIEMIQKKATVICEPSLRPAIFNIPRDSPPDSMFKVMEKLNKSGKRCISCAKRLELESKSSS
ncbi:unnamed protein product [Orchesella dallaii]|uniref:Uncharacterized protein n=1 Tax=Orchesella dallaii TaxID=48710 RepID=A0ABP1R2N6_9HEXA